MNFKCSVVEDNLDGWLEKQIELPLCALFTEWLFSELIFRVWSLINVLFTSILSRIYCQIVIFFHFDVTNKVWPQLCDLTHNMQKKVYKHAVKTKKHFYIRPFIRMRYLFTSMAVVIGYCNNLYEFTRCKHKTTLACRSFFLCRICVRYNSHNLDIECLMIWGLWVKNLRKSNLYCYASRSYWVRFPKNFKTSSCGLHILISKKEVSWNHKNPKIWMRYQKNYSPTLFTQLINENKLKNWKYFITVYSFFFAHYEPISSFIS